MFCPKIERIQLILMENESNFAILYSKSLEININHSLVQSFTSKDDGISYFLPWKRTNLFSLLLFGHIFTTFKLNDSTNPRSPQQKWNQSIIQRLDGTEHCSASHKRQKMLLAIVSTPKKIWSKMTELWIYGHIITNCSVLIGPHLNYSLIRPIKVKCSKWNCARFITIPILNSMGRQIDLELVHTHAAGVHLWTRVTVDAHTHHFRNF